MYLITAAIFAVALQSASGFSSMPSSSALRKRMGLFMKDQYTIGIVGDLHLDPRNMEDHIDGREHFKAVLHKEESCPINGQAVVSLGDLGESKPCEEGTSELFAGTTRCFDLAHEFLDGFGPKYEVVGGNHDLEGIDEFPTGECRLYT